MTSLDETSGVEYPQQKVEEVREMPLRKCPYCKGLSNFNLGQHYAGPKIAGYVSIDYCQNCGNPVYFETGGRKERDDVIDCYPRLELSVDEELPEDVRKAFGEAVRTLNDGNWNSCVVMCRRALQEAMTDLGAEGKDLFHQIDDLEAKRKITPELKEWAHEGRVGGKLGAHGIGEKKWADQNDAEEITEFCRWFLRYLYVLPNQLANRKKALAEQANKSST
jgi:hypothetical protein